MKLQEIFDQLSSGEFSQISIGGANAGVIDETNYAKALNFVNLGITALYKRFSLKEGRLQLALQSNQTLYKLNSSFAVNVRRSNESVRYIIDTDTDPFIDDIIKVEKVITDGGFEMALNDDQDDWSAETPSALQLRVPKLLVSPPDPAVKKPDWMKDVAQLTVVYRAAHPKLTVSLGYFDPARVEVQLPDTHLMALCFNVASRVQQNVGMTAQTEGQLANNYYARYQAECLELEGQGLQVDQNGGSNTKLRSNGWV